MWEAIGLLFWVVGFMLFAPSLMLTIFYQRRLFRYPKLSGLMASCGMFGGFLAMAGFATRANLDRLENKGQSIYFALALTISIVAVFYLSRKFGSLITRDLSKAQNKQ